jgi:hypothetical protein
MPRRLDAIPGRETRDEQTLAMILALTSELAVTRARLDSCERLLTAAGVLGEGAIEGFTPDAAAIAEREQMRSRTIAKVLRPLRESAERELASHETKQDRSSGQ